MRRRPIDIIVMQEFRIALCHIASGSQLLHMPGCEALDANRLMLGRS